MAKANPPFEKSHSSTRDMVASWVVVVVVVGPLSACPCAHDANPLYHAWVLVMWSSLHPLDGEGLEESTTKGMASLAWVMARKMVL
jgi:hypothetical protein